MTAMKRTRIDLHNPTETEFGYKATITKQQYTHVFSNYYTTPKINLSQLQKKKLFFSTEVSQTEISEYLNTTFNYTRLNEAVYFKTTPEMI
jgi:hypothetical protein